MMLDDIMAALEADKRVADWRLTRRKRDGEEAFFMGRKLDLRREVRKLGYELVVYVDGEGADGSPCRGEAMATIHPTMGREELEAVVGRAAFAASRSRNPWYALPGRAPALLAARPGSFFGRASEAAMRDLIDALYSGEDGGGDASINSLELFLAREETRILNSRGVDASFSGCKAYVEFTVEAPSASGPVELTDFLSFSDASGERLAAEIASRLACVSDRVRARPTPPCPGLPLILSGANAEAILAWFFANLDSGRLYSRASPFLPGQSVQGELSGGDLLSLRAEAILEGASRSSPFDPEGRPLGRPLLCEKGMAKAFAGPSRYASYLGIEPLGSYSLFSVEAGASSAAELRARPHIEAAYFSDFNVDPDSGDFGAEIRLAYVSDGRTRYPVTGGSITGSLFENRGSLLLSKETGLVENMLGPEAILLPKVSLTAAT